MADISGRDLVLPILSLLAGALVTAVVTKLRNRTAKLTYTTRTQRIAASVNDAVFGAVRVTWHDTTVRNLHMAVIEIDNSSGRDFEQVDLKVYTTHDTVLLNEFTSVVGSPNIVAWSPEFKARLAVVPGEEATDQQMKAYNHTREYRVPVLNRGQMLRFSYMCTRPGDDTMPFVFVDAVVKGAKLVQQNPAALVHGVPVPLAAIRGSVVSVLVVIVCALFVSNVPIASAISMSTGLFAQSIGALLYKAERRLRTF